MLWPYLKIWDWDLIFGRAVKAVSLSGVHSPCNFGRSDNDTGMQQGGGQGGAAAPPDFGRSVNPIPTRGDRLCPPNSYWHPRILKPSDGPAFYHTMGSNLL